MLLAASRVDNGQRPRVWSPVQECACTYRGTFHRDDTHASPVAIPSGFLPPQSAVAWHSNDFFGDKTGCGQLVSFQSRRDKKSGASASSITPSVESGPLENLYVSSWEAAAETVALVAYSGLDRLIGDLRHVDLTLHNLRLLFFRPNWTSW